MDSIKFTSKSFAVSSDVSSEINTLFKHHYKYHAFMKQTAEQSSATQSCHHFNLVKNKMSPVQTQSVNIRKKFNLQSSFERVAVEEACLFALL